MAKAPAKPCGKNGCTELIREGYYCKKHQPKSTDYHDSRDQSQRRGYDWRWQQVRRLHRLAHPLCEDCLKLGRTRQADLVHHEQPIRSGGPRLDPANLVSLCRQCHAQRHQGEGRSKSLG